MKRIFASLLFLTGVFFFFFQKDTYTYPNVITEFVCIHTNEQGNVTALTTDNNNRYILENPLQSDGLTPDSLYRALSMYELLQANTAKLYTCQLVLSVNPLPLSVFGDNLKTDPVDIQSIWLSGNYLNLIVKEKAKDKVHYYHFIDEGITSHNGIQTLNLRLFHDRNNDYEAFTRNIYLSVPLSNYKSQLHKGDKIRFYIHTYKENETFREFKFNPISHEN